MRVLGRACERREWENVIINIVFIFLPWGRWGWHWWLRVALMVEGGTDRMWVWHYYLIFPTTAFFLLLNLACTFHLFRIHLISTFPTYFPYLPSNSNLDYSHVLKLDYNSNLYLSQVLTLTSTSHSYYPQILTQACTSNFTFPRY